MFRSRETSGIAAWPGRSGAKTRRQDAHRGCPVVLVRGGVARRRTRNLRQRTALLSRPSARRLVSGADPQPAPGIVEAFARRAARVVAATGDVSAGRGVPVRGLPVTDSSVA